MYVPVLLAEGPPEGVSESVPLVLVGFTLSWPFDR